MANQNHIDILKKGVKHWNRWRQENPEEKIDLSHADISGGFNKVAHYKGINFSDTNLNWSTLTGADLIGADLSRANLIRADLTGAHLVGAKLQNALLDSADAFDAKFDRADLREATLIYATLKYANLSKANLRGANLNGANLSDAILKNADLRESSLNKAILTGTNLEGTNLSNCEIYGISAWDVILNNKTIQTDLKISKLGYSHITVDNLEVAQFIYLILNNKKIRSVIDTITSKVVLILGRFYDERKAVLDAIREELRNRNYLPVIFDFEEPTNRDVRETVSTLAHISKFVIADITDPSSIPLELEHIVPFLSSVPVIPLLQEGYDEFSMFKCLRKSYNWVLKTTYYKNCNELIDSINEKVIIPVEKKSKEVNDNNCHKY